MPRTLHQKSLPACCGDTAMAALAAAAPAPPAGEDAGAIYLAAVRAVMSRWTLLRLAVDQGWSDGDGAAQANQLVEDVCALVSPYAKKAPYVEDIEDLLFDTIESKFNSMAEDGSVEEIAKCLIALRNECAAGALANAKDAILKAQQQAPQLAQCVSSGEPDENVDSDDDMDAAAPSAPAPPAPAPKPEPIVDEDGFTTVPKKDRRRRP